MTTGDISQEAHGEPKDDGPFFLFSGDAYYPSGGMDDYGGAFATLDEAIAAYASDKRYMSWCNIAVMHDGELVKVHEVNP